MPEPKRPMCSNCPYYDNGVCRKHAPRHATPSYYAWPQVCEQDWCGQHPAIELMAQQKMIGMLANGGVDMMGDLFDKIKGRI